MVSWTTRTVLCSKHCRAVSLVRPCCKAAGCTRGLAGSDRPLACPQPLRGLRDGIASAAPGERFQYGRAKRAGRRLSGRTGSAPPTPPRVCVHVHRASLTRYQSCCQRPLLLSTICFSWAVPTSSQKLWVMLRVDLGYGWSRGKSKLRSATTARHLAGTSHGQALLAARIDRLPPEDKRLLRPRRSLAPRCPGRCCRPSPMCPKKPYRSLAQSGGGSSTRPAYFPSVPIPSSTPSPMRWRMAVCCTSGGVPARAHCRGTGVPGGDRLDDQVERLAQHAQRGEVWEKALAYGRQAGDKALTRSAYREAAVCYRAGAHRLGASPPTVVPATEQAIVLRLGLCTALTALGEAPGRMFDHVAPGRDPRRDAGRPTAARAGLRRA